MDYSVSHSRLAPGQVKPLAMSAQDVQNFRALEKLGIGFEPGYLRAASAAMDTWTPQYFPSAAAPAGVTTPSIVTPIQFLQNWLPGFVHVLTAARKIDEFIGIETIGN